MERLEDFLQTVRGMPKEFRRALADGCECLVVYGATLAALGAPRALARLGFEPASVLRVVPALFVNERRGMDGDNSIETTLSLASFAERGCGEHARLGRGGALAAGAAGGAPRAGAGRLRGVRAAERRAGARVTSRTSARAR